jgi:hypothetical protein
VLKEPAQKDMRALTQMYSVSRLEVYKNKCLCFST